MIDYLHIVFDIEHEPFGDQLINRSAATGQERMYLKRIKVQSTATSLDVKSTHNGTRIEIEGNFAKFLQGHNIFGTNNLVGLTVDVVETVLAKLNIDVTAADIYRISRGKFTVKRVDLAGNFSVASRDEVAKVIREIEYFWRSLGFNVSNYGTETVYYNQHKEDTLKFYDKLKELASHPLPKDIPHRDRLLKYVEKLIRCERTFRSRELRRRKLDTGEAWSIALAKQLLLDEIAALELQGDIKRLLLDDEYDALPSNVKSTYRLWLHGDDARTICGYQKFRRHQKILMQHGINIYHSQPKEMSVGVEIQTIFSPENMREFPQFARKHGLIHLPHRKWSEKRAKSISS